MAITIGTKKIKGHSYYYARECQRVEGKPRIVYQKYLGKAEKIIAARRRIFDLYHRSLRPLEEGGLARLPSIENDSVANGHLFYLITRTTEERTRLIKHLDTRRIQAVIHYVPLHSSPAGKKYGRVSGHLRVTEDLSGRLLRLPLYYEMSDEDAGRVVASVKEFYAGSP